MMPFKHLASWAVLSATVLAPVAFAQQAPIKIGAIWEVNATFVELTARGLSNFIRTSPDSANFAATSVETVKQLIAPALKMDPKQLKVWLEHEESIYRLSIAKEQERLFDEAGIKVTGIGSYSSKSIDLNDRVLRATAAPGEYRRAARIVGSTSPIGPRSASAGGSVGVVVPLFRTTPQSRPCRAPALHRYPERTARRADETPGSPAH